MQNMYITGIGGGCCPSTFKSDIYKTKEAKRVRVSMGMGFWSLFCNLVYFRHDEHGIFIPRSYDMTLDGSY